MISLTPADFSSVLDEARHCCSTVSCLDSHLSRPRSKKQQILAIPTAQLPQFDFFLILTTPTKDAFPKQLFELKLIHN